MLERVDPFPTLSLRCRLRIPYAYPPAAVRALPQSARRTPPSVRTPQGVRAWGDSMSKPGADPGPCQNSVKYCLSKQCQNGRLAWAPVKLKVGAIVKPHASICTMVRTFLVDECYPPVHQPFTRENRAGDGVADLHICALAPTAKETGICSSK